MGYKCPKCSYERQPEDLAPEYECPKCGVIYSKAEKALAKLEQEKEEKKAQKEKEAEEKKEKREKVKRKRNKLASIDQKMSKFIKNGSWKDKPKESYTNFFSGKKEKTNSNNYQYFQTNHLLGIIGSGFLFFGIFCPIVSLPIKGSVTYFNNGQGDGVIVLVLAAISLFYTLKKQYRKLLLTGGGTLLLILISFFRLQLKISEISKNLNRELSGNLFGGIAEAMFQSVQLQWGWAILIIGCALLIAAALYKTEISVQGYVMPFIFTVQNSKAQIQNKYNIISSNKHLKKFVLFGCIAVLFGAILNFYTTQEKIKGFRGVEWGKSSVQYNFLVKEKEPPHGSSEKLSYLVRKLVGTSYIRNNEVNEIEDVSVNGIYYIFFDDRFYRVQIEYDDKMYSILPLYENRYGSFKKNEDGDYKKKVGKVSIHIHEKGLNYVYQPIREEYDKMMNDYFEQKEERKNQY